MWLMADEQHQSEVEVVLRNKSRERGDRSGGNTVVSFAGR